MTAALFIGRFQPFHIGHMDAINQILKENDELILAIGYNGKNIDNPLSLKQRIIMLKKIINSRLKKYKSRIKLITIKDQPKHSAWMSKLNKKAGRFDTIYSGNKLVLSLYKKMYNIKPIKIRIKISATKIREMIRNSNKEWKKYVPKEIHWAAEKIKQNS